MAAMTKPELTEMVSQLVRECEDYRDQLSATRVRAMEYYDGVMADVPVEANRSKVVSRDVRAAVKKVLPSLIRTVLGNDKVVEYQPVNQGDEAGAEQATDYINYIVFPESDGYDAVQDAAHDALKLGNGIIRWWYEKKKSVEVSTHSGLDEAALVQLIADDTVEVLEQAQTTERIELPTGPVEQPVFTVKIRRTAERGATRLAAVPLEEFLVHPDAISIDDSPVAGIKRRMRRSDLIAMGYDRDLVEGFAIAGEADGEDEEFARRRGIFGDGEETATALQEVDYYELYVKVDADDDGIAELRRLVFAGGTGADNLLEDAEWDEVPFADLVTERRPHQREGNAITDDMAEIQRVKTVLLRQTLDNLYWQNNQQPIVQEGVIQNPESVLNPKFGQPIRVGQGVDVRGAVDEIFSIAEAPAAVVEALAKAASDEQLEAENAKLIEAFPEIADGEGRLSFFAGAFDVAEALGFSEAEVREVTDHRLFKLAHYARLGLAAEQAKKRAMSKLQRAAAPVARPRPAGKAGQAPARSREAMKRLTKSGSIRDAMGVDFD